MSSKVLLQTETYNVNSNASTGTSGNQEDADGLKIEGLALPFGKRSRNGVRYSEKSVKEAAETMIGNPLLFNHDENNPIGHVKDIEVAEKGLKYVADVNPSHEKAESIKRGDIPHVSIQAMVEEAEDSPADVHVTEFLELSAVTIPGFPQTTVDSEEVMAIEKFTDTETMNPRRESFEFSPMPDHVLYESKEAALLRAKKLGLQDVHRYSLDDEKEMWMAGSTHEEWLQKVSGNVENQEKEDEDGRSEEPFQGFEDWDDCIETMKKERGHDQESAEKICGALKKKDEIKNAMSNDSKEKEQLEEVAEDDFLGTVADMYEGLSASDASSLLGDFDFVSDPAPLVAVVADSADMTPGELLELLEQEEEADDEDDEDDESGDIDEPEDDEEQQGEQDGDKESYKKQVEKLSNKIDELEKQIEKLEDTEPSKQGPATHPENNDDGEKEDLLSEEFKKKIGR